MAKDEQFYVFILITLLLGMVASLQILSSESMTKNVGETLMVICKDPSGRPVQWKGPNGRLTHRTRPHLQHGSYGTAIIFENTRIEDTGNYTCSLTDSPREKKVFSLKVEDKDTLSTVTSSLYISAENMTKNIGETFLVFCKDQENRSVNWEDPNGRLTNSTRPRLQISSYGTAIVFNTTRIEDTGNYTCALSDSPLEKKVFSLKVEDMHAMSTVMSSLFISAKNLTKDIGQTFPVFCEDKESRPVKWEGPNGRLTNTTRPRLQIFSYGTAIVFNNTRIEDTGNYTCSLLESSREKKVFSLKVEDMDALSTDTSSLRIYAENERSYPENMKKNIGETFLVLCKDKKSRSVKWEGPNGRLTDSTRPRIEIYSYGTTIVFDNTRMEDTGNYTCAVSDSPLEQKVFSLKVEDMEALSTVTSSLHISAENVTKNIGENFLVICRDQENRSVKWEGPNGRLTHRTRPRVRISSYGTAILFENTLIEDTGNYTCALSDSPREKKVFSLKVEDMDALSTVTSSLRISAENVTKNIGENFLVFCKDQKSSSIKWESPNGRLTNTTRPRLQISSYGTAIVFENAQIEDTGNYTCSLTESPREKKVFSLTVEDMDAYIASLVSKRDISVNLTKDVGETFLLICKDNQDRSIIWEGPSGQLTQNTRPQLQISSFGTAIVFEKTKIEDTGTYTCSVLNSPEKKKVFNLQVEDMSSNVTMESTTEDITETLAPL